MEQARLRPERSERLIHRRLSSRHVACVVHHGGAGTTACGLLNGRPTTIVPFFGDQQFWGQMIAAAQAGPRPIHHKTLSAENLAEAIQYCLTPQALSAAAKISQKMRQENGVKGAVRSFRERLPIEALCCDLIPEEPAVWLYTRSKMTLKLSEKAAFILTQQKTIDAKHLTLYQSKPIHIEQQRWDPVTAGSAVLLGTLMNFTVGFSDVFTGPAKAFSSKSEGNSSKKAAVSVGKGFGKMVGVLPKATLVDFPLAMAEGLHQMPRLYGDEVRDNGRVKGWKSGGVVAGKTFGYGFVDGISGFVTKPYEGAKEGGWLGFSKGLAKGTMGLVAQPSAGMFGLMAYPALGMYRSLSTTSLSRTQQKIMLARQVYGSYLARQRGYSMQKKGESGDDGSVDLIVARFEEKKSNFR